MARTARQLLVWFHAITSIGWLTLALCLCTLLATSTAESIAAAEILDVRLLQHLGTSGAFSGLMLSALTQWGYFRYWWVLAKFTITIGQLYAGVFLLSPRLSTADPSDTTTLVVGSALMAGAFAFQAWLSVAKPWRQTPWARKRWKPEFPAWMFLTAIAIPVVDFVFWRFVFGAPAPVLSFLTALIFPFWRARALRT